MSDDDQKTIPEPDRRKWDPMRDMSNRIAKLEVASNKHGDAIQLLTAQLMDFLLRNTAVTHDVATTAIERLDISIDRMVVERDDLLRKIATSEDEREKFLLNMSLDNLQYRIQRERKERDEALIRKEGSEALVHETQEKINGMKRPGNDMTLSFPPIRVEEAKKPNPWKDAAFDLMFNIFKIVIAGLVIVLGQAIWYYFKAKVNGTIP